MSSPSLKIDPSEEATKPCGACHASLPHASYSKKQWQARKVRRCKDCTAQDREICDYEEYQRRVQLQKQREDDDEWARERKLLTMDGNEGVESLFGPVDVDKLFEQPPPTEDCGELFILLSQVR